MSAPRFEVYGLPGLPEIAPGTDLAEVIAAVYSARSAGGSRPPTRKALVASASACTT